MGGISVSNDFSTVCNSYYTKYNDYSGNGQSALLQAVRNSLMKTYSSSLA